MASLLVVQHIPREGRAFLPRLLGSGAWPLRDAGPGLETPCPGILLPTSFWR